MAEAVPTAFSDHGLRVMEEETVDAQDPIMEKIRSDPRRLALFYEIEDTAAWLRNGGYTRIALQFPDALLPDAVEVVAQLRSCLENPVNIFVLGDTSYGSCCVDEVAAQHAMGECVVHYGPACRSATTRLPVYYVFGQYPIHIDDCVEQMKHEVEKLPRTHSLLLLHDARFLYTIGRLVRALEEALERPVECGEMARYYDPTTDVEDTPPLRIGGQTIRHRTQIDGDVIVLYVGPGSSQLMNILLRCNTSTCIHYDPTQRSCQPASKVNKLLMRRYYLVQQAKAAQMVGILVGTLGVAHYMDTVNQLRTAINASGRRAYVFVVGKINVPKLANYAEIDLFVLVACPENSLLDSKEFYKPIVTPYEMQLALQHDREWTGDYRLDFQDIVPELVALEPQREPENDVPYFSLVSGTLEAPPHVNLAYDNATDPDEESALVCGAAHESALTTFVSKAGEFLATREFQGLDPRIGDDAAHAAQLGSRGIAKGYKDLI